MVSGFQSRKKVAFLSFHLNQGNPMGPDPGEKVKVTSNYFKVIKPRINISRLAHLIQSGTKQFHSFLLTTWKKYLN